MGWYPKYKNIYQSWDDDGRHHKNYSGMSGRVIIHIGQNQYPGSFSVGNTSATIRYGGGKEIVVQKERCRFTKHIEDRIVYYNAYIDEDSQNGEYMPEEKPDKKSGYGLDDREGNPEERSVIFRVPKEKAGLSRLTGRTSAIYLKKRYEDKLNEIWKEFDSTIEKITAQNTEFDKIDTTIPGLRKTLEVAREEWREALTSLGNILNKTMHHEWEMWKTTQKSRQIRVQKNAPKIKYSDVDEMNFNSMTDFIKQYPELQAQRNIVNAIENVEKKKNEVNDSQKEIDTAIDNRNFVVSTFEKLTQKAEDNLSTFEELIKEAEEKVNKSPYNKSKLWSVGKTEYEKDATKLELLPYRGKLEERKSVLKRVKGQHAKYERKAFVDMEH